MKFNIDNYKGKYVMHCKTEKEAMSFCDYLHKLGRKWCSGSDYNKSTMWHHYTERTAYNFNTGSFSDTDYYAENGYTILEWSDFMSGTFTRADLKTGDVIKRRDGDIEIFIREFDVFVRNDGQYNTLGGINYDLTSIHGTSRDIIAVRRPIRDRDCTFSAFEFERGTLVYEREEVIEMTLAEVCKLLGKNIKIVK